MPVLASQVMYRERAAGMYDELPFAVAQCLIELPYNLIQSFLFALISYWMLGFENNAGARQLEHAEHTTWEAQGPSTDRSSSAEATA